MSEGGENFTRGNIYDMRDFPFVIGPELYNILMTDPSDSKEECLVVTSVNLKEKTITLGAKK